MIIKHSAVSSPIFVLKQTYSFDLSLGAEVFLIKLELYQDINNEKQFRCLIWQSELIQVKAFIEEEVVDCTKFVIADWSTNLNENYSNFNANSISEATKIVATDIENYLINTTNEEN